MDKNGNPKQCAFCKYWEGARAEKQPDSDYHLYIVRQGRCQKHCIDRPYSFEKCDTFEFDREFYFEREQPPIFGKF